MQLHALSHMAPIGCSPKPIPTSTTPRMSFTDGERIGLWTVGAERRVEPSLARVRVCTCVCGRISHVPLDRLAKHRVADSGGCRKCVARKGSGLDPVVSAERAASTAAKLDVTASRAVARVTTEQRENGAAQNLRDLEERSPAEAHAARAAIERLHRELRESGRVTQAAWVHAVMRLADYAREGGR